MSGLAWRGVRAGLRLAAARRGGGGGARQGPHRHVRRLQLPRFKPHQHALLPVLGEGMRDGGGGVRSHLSVTKHGPVLQAAAAQGAGHAVPSFHAAPRRVLPPMHRIATQLDPMAPSGQRMAAAVSSPHGWCGRCRGSLLRCAGQALAARGGRRQERHRWGGCQGEGPGLPRTRTCARVHGSDSRAVAHAVCGVQLHSYSQLCEDGHTCCCFLCPKLYAGWVVQFLVTILHSCHLYRARTRCTAHAPCSAPTGGSRL